MTGNDCLIRALNGMKAAGPPAGPLVGAIVKLCKDDFFPDANMTPADLAAHEADYVGYAPSAALDWLEPYIAVDGSGRLPAGSVQFLCDDSTAVNIIYSYWIEAGTPPNDYVVTFKKLDSPQSLADIYDSVLIEPEYVMAQSPV